MRSRRSSWHEAHHGIPVRSEDGRGVGRLEVSSRGDDEAETLRALKHDGPWSVQRTRTSIRAPAIENVSWWSG